MNGHTNTPRSTPPALPAVVGFQAFACVERVSPVGQCERVYLLAVQPMLRGDVALVWTWGRIGILGKFLLATFSDRSSAQESVARLVCRRLHRRDELVAWT
jgi:predicted DNA-binding WGR domain protein